MKPQVMAMRLSRIVEGARIRAWEQATPEELSGSIESRGVENVQIRLEFGQLCLIRSGDELIARSR